MSNPIEPYDMIQKTNIKEHNDMINKINEIVDVINNTNLDTINTEISGLKAKATATDAEIANIKGKDATQDTEINGISKSLVSNVTATFDNPSRELKISLGREASPSIDATVVIPASSETGQYSAGNGITIQDYQIAVDTNVVALKTDIPIVPDVSEITNRLDTIDGEITGINTDITNITNKNTEQDTAIAGKVAISQGVENAGKVLGIGVDGNVTPVDGGGSSGGEVWEKVDLSNWPTDWSYHEKVKFIPKKFTRPQTPTAGWTNPLSGVSFEEFDCTSEVEISLTLDNSAFSLDVPYHIQTNNYYVVVNLAGLVQDYRTFWNTKSMNFMTLGAIAFNGGGKAYNDISINASNVSTYIKKMWRCRPST